MTTANTSDTVREDLARALEKTRYAEKSPMGGYAYCYEYLRKTMEQAIAALDRLQAGGPQTNTQPPLVKPQFGSPDHSEGDSATGSTAAAREETWECDYVSDEEADRVADELVGPIVSSPTARAYAGGSR